MNSPNICVWLLAILLCGGVSGCKKEKDKVVLSQVVDATRYNEEKEFLLSYDAEGRIVRYGNMEFSYKGNKINFQKLDSNLSYIFKDYSASAVVLKGRIKEITSNYKMQMDDSSDFQGINKRTTYDYDGDTLLITSHYRSSSTGRLLKAVQRKCILDNEKRVVEMDSSTDGMNDTLSLCSNFFDYQDNIQYDASLNLSAYSLGVKEPDEFFFFLFNLGEVVNPTALPNDITYNINNGSSLYQVVAHYQFQGDTPSRVELLRNEQQLLLRFDFQYLP
ncbi:MAG: hypothetical protein ACRCZY_11445 [Phocaeicola sp.]